MFIKISLNGAFSSSSSAKLLGSCCGRPAAPCLSVSLALVHSLMRFFFSPPPSPVRALTLYEAVRRLFLKRENA